VNLTIRLFAVARERAGCPTVTIDLAEGSTVADLRRAIAESLPDLAVLLPGMMIAVDSEYAQNHVTLRPESEVALIPPVSGG